MIGKWFRRKKEIKTPESEDSQAINEPEIKLEPEKVDLTNTESRLSYITHLYDEIKDAKQQCEDAKFEYGQATSYLKDIQLIDNAEPEERKVLREIAQGIHDLNKERNRIQKQKYKITDGQRQALDTHEDRIDGDLQRIKESEDYLIKVKNDLRQLTSEKNMLLNDENEIIQKQGLLRVLTKSVAIISIAMLALIITVYYCFKVDIVYPFLGLIAFIFIALVFIVLESRKNRIDMALTQQKCNRSITLLNRVKIKYVNTFHVIEAIVNRYSVRNGMELDFVYSQYRKAKAEWNRQQESTKVLAKYNQVLVHELQKLGVKDREIWFYQAEALVDDREMVEVRHRLNTQRQSMRQRLDYNADVMEKCLNEMEKIREKNQQYREDVENILKEKL